MTHHFINTHHVEPLPNLSPLGTDRSGSKKLLPELSFGLLLRGRSMESGETSHNDLRADKSASELALAREVGQLKRELEAMTRQRDILKKAIVIFSDDKSLSGGLK